MIVTKTFHPPAGITPLVVAHISPGWAFLFCPVLLGAIFTAVLARFMEWAENTARSS
jgi:CBS-domain-containing membrane protein